MKTSRFCLYEKENKFGLMDARTKKIVLNHSYDVVKFDEETIYLKNGDTLLLKDVLVNSDKITRKQRFFIVEDINTKTFGLFDNKLNKLVVFCSCEKIEHSSDGNGFVVSKGGKEKRLNYEKLKCLKYYPKGDFIIFVNNISMYFAHPFQISSKDGKKVEIHR